MPKQGAQAGPGGLPSNPGSFGGGPQPAQKFQGPPIPAPAPTAYAGVQGQGIGNTLLAPPAPPPAQGGYNPLAIMAMKQGAYKQNLMEHGALAPHQVYIPQNTKNVPEATVSGPGHHGDNAYWQALSQALRARQAAMWGGLSGGLGTALESRAHNLTAADFAQQMADQEQQRRSQYWQGINGLLGLGGSILGGALGGR